MRTQRFYNTIPERQIRIPSRASRCVECRHERHRLDDFGQRGARHYLCLCWSDFRSHSESATMTSDRDKPGVAFWATVVVVTMPFIYVLSAGPLVWLRSHGAMSEVAWKVAMIVYWPLDRLTPEPF